MATHRASGASSGDALERARPGAVPRAERRFRLGLLLVVALALALRVAYLAEIAGTPFRDERALISDARFYDDRAQQIADGDLIGQEPGYLSPVYCYAMGALYALFGPDPWHVKQAQALLGALTAALVAIIGRRVFGPRAGLAAGLVFGLYPLHVYYTGLILPTVVETLCNLAFVALLLPGERGFSRRRTALAGLALGLAVGAKPNALLAIPLAVIWLFVALRGRGWRVAATHALLLVAGTALTVAPITWRNHSISGEFVLVSVVGGRNLMKGNGPDADGTHIFLPAGEQGVSLSVVTELDLAPTIHVEDDRRLKREVLDYVLANPGRTAKLLLKKAFLFLNASELGIRDQYAFARDRFRVLGANPLSFGLLAPLGIVGALFALRRGPPAWLVHGMLAVQMLSFVIVFVLGRYRLVAVGCLAVFALGELARWIELARARDFRRLAAPLALLVPVAVLVNAPSGFPRERGYADQHAFVGQQLIDRRDWAGALEAWREVLDASWQNPRWHLTHDVIWERIALCLAELGRLEEARDAGETALAQARALPPPRATRREAQVRATLAELGIELAPAPETPGPEHAPEPPADGGGAQ